MREHRQLFIQIAEHLEDKNHAKTLRGLILADRVLHDNDGLLSDPARSDDIGPALAAALKALEHNGGGL